MLNKKDGGTINAGVQPRFVDSIFLLFRKSYEYKTIYENPRFKTFILKMGFFGNIPQTPIRSDGPILFELTQNAMKKFVISFEYNPVVYSGFVRSSRAINDFITFWLIHHNVW